jgi:hypothetical protein
MAGVWDRMRKGHRARAIVKICTTPHTATTSELRSRHPGDGRTNRAFSGRKHLRHLTPWINQEGTRRINPAPRML